MHEEPMVCTPRDALRAFREGNVDYLSMGPFLVSAVRERGVAGFDSDRSATGSLRDTGSKTL